MATTRLEKLLEFYKNEPNDEFLKYALATEYLSLNETDKALGFYQDLVNNHPNYVGTYYHLGKLYEKLDRIDDAIKTYEQGMLIAKQKRDNHALSELQGVYMQLKGFDDDDDDY